VYQHVCFNRSPTAIDITAMGPSSQLAVSVC